MFVLVTLADGRHVGLISFGVPLSLLLHVLVQLAAFAERFEAVLEFCLANLALLGFFPLLTASFSFFMNSRFRSSC